MIRFGTYFVFAGLLVAGCSTEPLTQQFEGGSASSQRPLVETKEGAQEKTTKEDGQGDVVVSVQIPALTSPNFCDGTPLNLQASLPDCPEDASCVVFRFFDGSSNVVSVPGEWGWQELVAATDDAALFLDRQAGRLQWIKRHETPKEIAMPALAADPSWHFVTEFFAIENNQAWFVLQQQLETGASNLKIFVSTEGGPAREVGELNEVHVSPYAKKQALALTNSLFINPNQGIFQFSANYPAVNPLVLQERVEQFVIDDGYLYAFVQQDLLRVNLRNGVQERIAESLVGTGAFTVLNEYVYFLNNDGLTRIPKAGGPEETVYQSLWLDSTRIEQRHGRLYFRQRCDLGSSLNVELNLEAGSARFLEDDANYPFVPLVSSEIPDNIITTENAIVALKARFPVVE